MKPSAFSLAAALAAAPGLTSCSLVTVPVKVAGGIVETTVETTGEVATAPFKAIGGRSKDKDKDKPATPPAQPSTAGPQAPAD